jgi:RHS repeat-associated protein
MLSQVVDKEKGQLDNQYNGLGFRVASTRPEEKIEYLCDLSRDYYNLLERTVNGETESFIYDNNVVSMSKSGNNYYYLQDELGSPMYMTGTDGVAVSSYAFDDFGRNVDPRTGKLRKHEYTTNGNIIQPFAFTGYQEDEVSGLKFAQARFYSAENGRFVGVDQIKGYTDDVETQHQYIYCINNPLQLIDVNGKSPVEPNIPTSEEQSIDENFIPNTYITAPSETMCPESGVGVSSEDISKGSSLVQNGLEVTKLALVASAKIFSKRSKQISAALRSARIARPGHSLSPFRSNNAVRKSMREAAKKSLNRAGKATKMAEKLDKIGKGLSVASVAVDVGIGIYDNVQNHQPKDRIISDMAVDGAVSTLEIVGAAALTTLIFGSGIGVAAIVGGIAIGAAITYLVDDYRGFKGKTIRETAKDKVYNLKKKIWG